MNSIEFFCGTGNLSTEFEKVGFDALSLDNVQLTRSREVTFVMDFMDFDYRAFPPGHFDVLFFGLPCTAFSKASGGKHFTKNFEPKTNTAITSVLMLQRCIEIINYFFKAVWYIENPAGRLVAHPITKEFIRTSQANIYRIDMLVFGFPTKKQTDIITNSPVLFMCCPVHRVNGKYQLNKFDNLTLRQRQAYTPVFAKWISENALKSHIARGKKPPAERHKHDY